MLGKILCVLTLHKWGEQERSLQYMYRLKGRLYRQVTVRCQRPGCERSKSVAQGVK